LRVFFFFLGDHERGLQKKLHKKNYNDLKRK